ncbi:MAG: hypothetical protein AB7O80_08075 [Acetobacteraceae bacterium]
MTLLRMVLSCMFLVATCGGARAAPVLFERDLSIPPVVEDQGKPLDCTALYLVTDVSTNDVFAVRMRIAPAENDRPLHHRMPCPDAIPPRLAVRAMDACASHSVDPNTCVFTDMSRGFEREPAERNTASNASRCTSDKADFAAIACWKSGTLEVCNVGCGATEQAATAAARERCEDKHQRSCPITGAVPVPIP